MLDSPGTRKIIGYQIATLGLYYFYWSVISRREINKAIGSNYISSVWFLAIPAVHYYWIWQYAHALDGLTSHRLKYSETFLLYIIAMAVPITIIISIINILLAFIDDETSRRFGLLGVITGVTIVVFLWLFAGNTFFMATMQKRIDKVRQVV
jgi:hypothetical protein